MAQFEYKGSKLESDTDVFVSGQLKHERHNLSYDHHHFSMTLIWFLFFNFFLSRLAVYLFISK